MLLFNKKENKIIVRFFGGLGNQLFIFAFSKSQALNNNALLVADSISGFLFDRYRRTFLLSVFSIEISSLSYHNAIWLKFLMKLKLASRKITIIKENNSRCFEPNLLSYRSTTPITFFQGYWQSYKYFELYSDEIRGSINIDKLKVNNDIQILANKIKNTESIAIHIRRVQYEDKLDINYYLKALDIFRDLDDKQFFVFSDDIEWCKTNFYFREFTYISGNSEVEDFYLMSKCKKFIIANSSFSWWAAWLSTNKLKKVVAPKNMSIGCINEFYPNDWILI